MKKYALVTGASRGIGRSIALTLSKELSYPILVNYASNSKAAEETVAMIEANGGEGELMHFDVGNPEQTREVLEKWMADNPDSHIEVLVNNAGVTADNLFVFMEQQQWDSVLNISLNGFYNVTRTLIQPMVRKRYGRIINVVSLSGLKGVAGQVNYSAAKAGVIGATKALAAEVAKRNITVNAVAPGFIRTDMTASLDEKELAKLVPMNRFGEAEEVADLVTFLASPKAAYITGEVININGGIYS